MWVQNSGLSPRRSAALLKAVLIAGAGRLRGTAPAGAVLDPHQGYGRIDVAAVLEPAAGVTLRFQRNRMLVTGQSRRTTVAVADAGAPLRVVLTYSDYPGAALVNNLNLLVTAPDGTVRVGKQAAGAPPVFNTVNNTEVVHVTSPAAGTWTIDVVGANVPRGPTALRPRRKGKLA